MQFLLESFEHNIKNKNGILKKDGYSIFNRIIYTSGVFST